MSHSDCRRHRMQNRQASFRYHSMTSPPFLLVLLVRCYNRSSGKAGPGCGGSNGSSFKSLPCSVDLSLRSFLHIEKFSQALFDCFQVFLLSGCQFRKQGDIIRLLFPLPYKTPMPKVTIGKAVVSWQLLVRCRAQVHLLFQKGQAIQKDAPLRSGATRR